MKPSVAWLIEHKDLWHGAVLMTGDCQVTPVCLDLWSKITETGIYDAYLNDIPPEFRGVVVPDPILFHDVQDARDVLARKS